MVSSLPGWRALHKLRDGRPLVDRAAPAHAWILVPTGYDEVRAVRDPGRLPRGEIGLLPEPDVLVAALSGPPGDLTRREAVRMPDPVIVESY